MFAVEERFSLPVWYQPVMSAGGPSALCPPADDHHGFSCKKAKNFGTLVLKASAATNLWFAGGGVILFTTLFFVFFAQTKKGKFTDVSKTV